MNENDDSKNPFEDRVAYPFPYDVSDDAFRGHTVVLGPTGAGKTIMNSDVFASLMHSRNREENTDV